MPRPFVLGKIPTPKTPRYSLSREHRSLPRERESPSLYPDKAAILAIRVNLKAEVAMYLNQALYSNAIYGVENGRIVVTTEKAKSRQTHGGGNIFGRKPLWRFRKPPFRQCKRHKNI